MERYICIHGHFYQPPRENPWLEDIELQDSAYPYHDWNERITAECYAPNTASRILDGEGRIIEHRQQLCQDQLQLRAHPAVLAARQSTRDLCRPSWRPTGRARRRFSGHGSAMAQAYNHMIMPLANRRDKDTQVLWGIRDFEHRFGGTPEGMWLPETAVDLETLEILAELGIRFTILAPHQAHRVRKIGRQATGGMCSGGRIDPTTALSRELALGRDASTCFFYDGPISQAVAFEDLLKSGRDLCRAVWSAPSPTTRHWPQLVHIATDGETYGHHHRYGDMALAYALHYIETNDLARTHQLRRVPGKAPAHPRGGNHRKHVLELRPRRRALAERLRLQRSGKHPDWNQAVADAPARTPWTGCATRWPPGTRKKRRRLSERPVGGPRRLHRRHPRPLRREASSAFSEHAARALER